MEHPEGQSANPECGTAVINILYSGIEAAGAKQGFILNLMQRIKYLTNFMVNKPN